MTTKEGGGGDNRDIVKHKITVNNANTVKTVYFQTFSGEHNLTEKISKVVHHVKISAPKNNLILYFKSYINYVVFGDRVL